MRRTVVLAVILAASGCTIVGASTGAIVGHPNDSGRDAVIGGVIGAVVDLTVYGLYQFVQSSMTVK